MSNIYLLDGNSIAHANHNATTLTVGDFQVQAIFGFLKSIRALMSTAPHRSSLMVLWDGKAQFRKETFPEYKGNREDLDEEARKHKAAFDRQMPFLEKMLETLGVKQVRHPALEADDLASFFTDRLAHRESQVVLVSGDKDWIQLVRPNVTWFDPIRDRKVYMDNLLEMTGYYSTSAFVEGKALVGDHSDNVPGIPGVGDKTAQLLLAEWGSVQKFWDAVDSGKHTPAERKSKTAKSQHPEQVIASPEGRHVILRNVYLMDLRNAPAPKPGELIIKQKPAEPEKFIAMCERLNFVSIIREKHGFFRDLGVTLPVTEPA